MECNNRDMAKTKGMKMEPEKTVRGYGVGDPQQSIRFTKAQHETLTKLMYEHPIELRSFADALRAVICRSPFIPKKRLDGIAALFAKPAGKI